MPGRIVVLLIVLTISASAMPTFAADKNQEAMTAADIRSRVAEAQRKDRRLIIQLKNGKSVSGLVALTSPDTFSLTHTHGVFGDGPKEVIRYADVAAVKARNPFVKGVKDVLSWTGIGTLGAAGAGAMIALTPVFLVMAIFGYSLPSC